MNRSVGRDNVAGAGRGRGVGKGQSRKDFLPSQNGIGKKAPDDIQIRHTASLIKEASKNGLIQSRNCQYVLFLIYVLSLNLDRWRGSLVQIILIQLRLRKQRKC